MVRPTKVALSLLEVASRTGKPLKLDKRETKQLFAYIVELEKLLLDKAVEELNDHKNGHKVISSN